MRKSASAERRGWRTTEFWVSVAVSLVGVLVATGAVDAEMVERVAGAIMAGLSSAGYSLSRGAAKG